MTKRADKWPIIGWWWHHSRNIIRGGFDIVTDKTKKKLNKPKEDLETAQPTAARIKKPKAEQETAQPTAARFNKTFNKRKNRALLTLRRSQKHYEIFSHNVLRKNITQKQLGLETIEIAWFRVGSVPAL